MMAKVKRKHAATKCTKSKTDVDTFSDVKKLTIKLPPSVLSENHAKSAEQTHTLSPLLDVQESPEIIMEELKADSVYCYHDNEVLCVTDKNSAASGH